MKKIIDLRKLDTTKLKTELKSIKKEMVDKKMMYGAGKEKDTSIFSKYRKEIARINTVLMEKEVLNEQENN